MKKYNENQEEKINFIGKIKASFSGRKFRSGAYLTLISTIVVVIVLVVNMLITKMNIQIDLSSQSMYTLTKDTKEMAAGITDDITIYHMVQTGNELEVFQKIAEKYDGLSDNITLESKDPVLYPTFAADYIEDEVAENSFLVVDNTNGRAKYIDYNDMLVQEMNYETYTYTTTGVDVEGELTAAILYVTSETTPVLYVVEGHGETVPGATFEETVAKMNITTESIKTVSAESIPEDCDILYINSPTVDFSEEEATMIKDYLASGKDLIVTLNYKAEDLEHFLSVLEYYGVTMVKGIVFEGNSNMHYSNNPLYILPNVERNDITTQTSDSEIPVIMPQSSAVTSSLTTRSSLTFTPLLTTSEASYSKEASNITTAEKEDLDTEGPFSLGLLATDTYEETQSYLAVFGTEYTFDDSTLSYANGDLLKDTIGYMIGDTAVTVSIPTKSIEAEIIYPSQMQALAWGVILVIFVPAAILITGIVVSLRRRKK